MSRGRTSWRLFCKGCCAALVLLLGSPSSSSAWWLEPSPYDANGDVFTPATLVQGCQVVAQLLDANGDPTGAPIFQKQITTPAIGAGVDLGPKCPTTGTILWSAFCWNTLGTSPLEQMTVTCDAPTPGSPFFGG